MEQGNGQRDTTCLAESAGQLKTQHSIANKVNRLLNCANHANTNALFCEPVAVEQVMLHGTANKSHGGTLADPTSSPGLMTEVSSATLSTTAANQRRYKALSPHAVWPALI